MKKYIVIQKSKREIITGIKMSEEYEKIIIKICNEEEIEKIKNEKETINIYELYNNETEEICIKSNWIEYFKEWIKCLNIWSSKEKNIIFLGRI